MTRFNDLSNHVMTWIFDMLPKIDWMTLKFVCHRWKMVFDDLPIININPSLHYISPLRLIQITDVRSTNLDKHARCRLLATLALCNPMGRIHYRNRAVDYLHEVLYEIECDCLRQIIPFFHDRECCNYDIVRFMRYHMSTKARNKITRQLKQKLSQIVKNRDSRLVVTYLDNNTFVDYLALWSHGEKDLAIALWDEKRISCQEEMMMFLYAHQKYSLELYNCQVADVYWHLALKYKTIDPVEMIRTMAAQRDNPRIRRVAQTFCIIYPSVSELWNKLKSEPLIIHDYDDGLYDYEWYYDDSDEEDDGDVGDDEDENGIRSPKNRGFDRWKLQQKHLGSSKRSSSFHI